MNQHIKNKPDTRNVLMLGLLYNFISYTAEYMRVSRITRQTIMAARVILRSEINEMNEKPEYSELIMLTRLFYAIVDSIRPPYIPPVNDAPSPVRTFSAMSASVEHQFYGDLSGVDTDDEVSLEYAKMIWDKPQEWSDTEESIPSPNQQRMNKDTQRADHTPQLQHKRDRHIRNAANFPDTPELYTPQPKRLKKSEIKAARAKTNFSDETLDPDSFPIQPPMSPPTKATSSTSKLTSPPLAPRVTSTPQSSPRRAIGRMGMGAPIWNKQKKKIAAPPAQSSSSSSSSSRSATATTPSAPKVDSGSAAHSKLDITSAVSSQPKSGSSKSHGILSGSAALSTAHSASAAPQSPISASAAHSVDSPQYWKDDDVNSDPAAPAHTLSGSAAPAHADSASAASTQVDSGSAAPPRAFTTYHRRPRPVNAYVVDLTSPARPRRVLPRLRKKSPANLNFLHAVGPSHRILAMAADKNKTIIDSGASTSGTGLRGKLKNLRPASCTVNAAFGETIRPSEMGDLPPYMLQTIVIDGMKDTTLLSVSQACAEGMCGVFTPRDCLFFDIKEAQPHLAKLSRSCKVMLRGEVEDGLYIQKST